MTARWLTALAMVTLTACPPVVEPRPPAAFSIQLATRQSCGVLSGLDYDTSCLAAVYVKVLDETRQPVLEKCVSLVDDRSADLRELLNRPEPVIRLTGLSAQGVVTLDVRGFHDKGFPDESPCQNPSDESNWLFWGVSEPVSLAEYDDGDGPPLVRVVLDCRDCTAVVDGEELFGCAGIREEPVGNQCGPEMPSSFCVPVVACEKGCEDDGDCFEGARACVDGACDTGALTGELCSPCGGAIACGDGFTCVQRPGQEPFCAALCPGLDACPTGTKCNRLGNQLERAP